MLVDNIRALCKARGITIQKLEKETGIANGAVASWVRKSPKMENVAKVAAYFNVSIDTLIGQEPLKESDIPPDVLALAATIQELPPEARALVEQQIKVFASMDKK